MHNDNNKSKRVPGGAAVGHGCIKIIVQIDLALGSTRERLVADVGAVVRAPAEARRPAVAFDNIYIKRTV